MQEEVNFYKGEVVGLLSWEASKDEETPQDSSLPPLQ